MFPSPKKLEKHRLGLLKDRLIAYKQSENVRHLGVFIVEQRRGCKF